MRDLYAHQLELERKAVESGKAEYRRKLLSSRTGREKPLDQQPSGHLLVRKWLPVLTEALKDSLAQTRGSVDARKARAQIKELGLAEEDVMFTTFNIVVREGLMRGKPLQALATSIGNTLKSEVRLRAFNKSHNAYVRKVIESYDMEQRLKKGKKSGRLSETLLRAQKRLVGVNGEEHDFDSLEGFRIGMEPLKVLLAVCSEFFILSKPTKKRLARVVATTELIEWVAERNEVASGLLLRYAPMVVPPVDRSSTHTNIGGYLSLPSKCFPTPSLYRKHRCKPSDLNIAAINLAQRTPWQVNGEVLEILKWALDLEIGLGGLPTLEPYPESPKAEGLSKDQRENLKVTLAKIWVKNHSELSKLLAIKSVIGVAKGYKKYDKIYFPHNFDWRGRIYPLVSGLNPQGDKVAKGILRFAKAKPLGANGYRWLAIHIANCFGMDKLSFDDRVAWVEDAENDILRAAKDPRGHLWWTDADSPWQFLAGCLEWRRMIEFEGPLESFESQIPVALDGTCSGLQHFSAMLRDSRGGASVNLVPSDQPSDIYKEVAEELQRSISSDPENRPEMQRIWDGFIDRSLCKRGTMTRPYSVSRRGMGDQLLDLINKEEKYQDIFDRCRFESARMHDRYTEDEWANLRPADKPSPTAACYWLSTELEKAIDAVVIGSRLGQEFLVTLARVYAKAGIPFRWRTPILGMEISQGYLKHEEIRVATYFGGTRIRMTIKDTGVEPKANKRKQGQGASPNFVHSLDATHLMLTVLECSKRAKMDSFALVHDSFGVHAGLCDVLSQALRNTFVAMYTPDQLKLLRDQAFLDLPEEHHQHIPTSPELGDLDLQAVRMSKYLFC